MDRARASLRDEYERCPQCFYKLPRHSVDCRTGRTISRRSFLKRLGAIGAVGGIGGMGGIGYLLGTAQADTIPTPGTIIGGNPASIRRQIPATHVLWDDGSAWHLDSMIGGPDHTSTSASYGTDVGPLFNALATDLGSTAGALIQVRIPQTTVPGYNYINNQTTDIGYALATPIVFATHNAHIVGVAGQGPVYNSSGGGGSFIKAEPSAPMIRCTSSFPTTSPMITFGGAAPDQYHSYVGGGVENMILDGTNQATACVDVQAVQGTKFTDVLFANISGTSNFGLGFHQASGPPLSGHHVNSCTFRNLQIGMSADTGWGQSWMVDSYFVSCTDYGVIVYSAGGDNKYIGNHFEGIAGTGNPPQGLSGTAMFLQEPSPVVQACLIGQASGNSPQYHGIYYRNPEGSSKPALFLGNRFVNCNGGSHADGSAIVIGEATQLGCARNTQVLGNGIWDSDAKLVFGIRVGLYSVDRAAANLTIQDNSIFNYTSKAVSISAELPSGFGLLKGNFNGNPWGYISTPYDNTNNYVGVIPGGGSTTPTSGKTYKCSLVPLDIILQGGRATAVKKNGQTIWSTGGAAIPWMSFQMEPPTDTFSVTFTSAPISKVFGQ